MIAIIAASIMQTIALDVWPLVVIAMLVHKYNAKKQTERHTQHITLLQQPTDCTKKN